MPPVAGACKTQCGRLCAVPRGPVFVREWILPAAVSRKAPGRTDGAEPAPRNPAKAGYITRRGRPNTRMVRDYNAIRYHTSTARPDAGADLIGKVTEFVSSMRFPDRISRVMARASGDGSIRILIVHGYESHSGAIAASRRSVDALEGQLPDADFEFSYVKSGRFAEEGSRGFVDVMTCPT